LFEVDLPDMKFVNPVLGRILFQSMEIHIYRQVAPRRARERFTLAHELAHHILNHSRYMFREYCDEEDFTLSRSDTSVGTAIARMEFQANYFASCLLMPRTNFIEDFRRLAQTRDILDKGFGALYLDNQRCNLESYELITNALMRAYGVSRTAATIRLEALGLLRDARTYTPLRSSQPMPLWLTGDDSSEPHAVDE
jgi:Zn-dependent peptidase ImmA (M78 family)